MTSVPLVSVVVPTCNRPELVLRAIRSVLTQTFQDFEVIVVDDGFKESAAEAVATFSDARIRYRKNEISLGGGGTRNKGIREARGQYVAFLDDDDEWVPDKLERQMRIFREAEEHVGFVFCAVENVYPDKTVITEVDPDLRDYSIKSLTRFKGFLTSGLVVRRDVFDDVGLFDPALPSHQEADLILRIAQKYHGIGINLPLVRMRMSSSDDHIGGNIWRRIKGREMVLEKHRDLFRLHPELYAKQQYWLGLFYRTAGDFAGYARACRASLRARFTWRVLGHYIKASIVASVMSLKRTLIQVLNPMHVGLMLRLMYAARYFPAFVFSRPGVAVLDAGCGRGRYSEAIARRNLGASILGIDIHEEKEWKEYQYQNTSFRVQDLMTYDEHETRDFILCVDVLEHIRNNREVVTRFAAALKKGGWLYIAVPCDATSPHVFPQKWFHAFHEWEEDEHVGEQYTLNEWKTIITDAGLAVRTARYTFTWWGTLAWEMEFLLHQRSWGRRINIVLAPFYRLCAYLDIYMPIGTGNNLVVAEKIH